MVVVVRVKVDVVADEPVKREVVIRFVVCGAGKRGVEPVADGMLKVLLFDYQDAYYVLI